MFSVPNNYNWQCSNEGKKKLDVEKITLEAKDWETIHLPKKLTSAMLFEVPTIVLKDHLRDY